MVSKDIVFKTRLSLLCLLPQVLGSFWTALRSWLLPSLDYGLGPKVIFPGSCPGLSKHISTVFGPRLSQSLITCFIVFITMSLCRSAELVCPCSWNVSSPRAETSVCSCCISTPKMAAVGGRHAYGPTYLHVDRHRIRNTFPVSFSFHILRPGTSSININRILYIFVCRNYIIYNCIIYVHVYTYYAILYICMYYTYLYIYTRMYSHLYTYKYVLYIYMYYVCIVYIFVYYCNMNNIHTYVLCIWMNRFQRVSWKWLSCF